MSIPATARVSESHGLPLAEAELNQPFRRLFEHASEQFPERTALISLWQHEHAERESDNANYNGTPSKHPAIRWTYKELNDRAGATASWLRLRGCKAGDALVSFLWNSAEWAVFFWAAAKLDVTFVPLDARALANPSEAGYLLGTTYPVAMVVVQDGEAARMADRALAEHPGRLSPRPHGIIKLCCSAETTPPPGWVAQNAIINPARPAAEISCNQNATTSWTNGGREDDGNPEKGEERTGKSFPPWTASISHQSTSKGRNGVVASSFPLSSSSSPSSSLPAPTTHEQPYTAAAAAAAATTSTEPPLPSSSPGGAPALVAFTSGTTTARPKGCPHSARSLWSQSFDYDPHPAVAVADRWLVHTPVSHVFAVNNCLRAWRYGHAVVFASRVFDAGASLRALARERCTFMAAVPALVRALAAHPDFPGRSPGLGLRYVTMGGTVIGEDDVRAARELLGAESVIQGYGLSEGAPLVSWRRPDPLLRDGYHDGVGKVLPGARVRVCRPGGREPVPRGEAGELHVGGTSVIEGYLHGESAGSFYEDGHGRWLCTGDQASMDEDGVVYVLGRYKDLIVRGGEKISPMKIEAALHRVPGVLAAQVVGVPDSVAGEMPAAVILCREEVDKSLVGKAVRSLGPLYSLAAILFLQELGLKAFPATSSGKVKKQVLKNMVLEHLESGSSQHGESAETREQDAIESDAKTGHSKEHGSASFSVDDGQFLEIPSTSKGVEPGHEDILTILQDIIYQLAHARPGPDDDLEDYGDSITVLKYCDKVLGRLGVRVHIQDFAESRTLRLQARIIAERRNVATSNDAHRDINGLLAPRTPRAAEPSNKSVASTQLGLLPASFSSTWKPSIQQPETHDPAATQTRQKTIAGILSQLGLGNDDIEDILPMRPVLRRLIAGPRPQTYQHRICFKISESIPLPTVRHAVQAAIAIRPMLRAAIATPPSTAPFHIILRPSQPLFSSLIHETRAATDSAAKALLEDESPLSFPDPLTVQACIIAITPPEDEDASTAYLRMTMSHSAFDAVSLAPFYNDLDKLLRDPTWTPPPSTAAPYAPFADLASRYATSLPAAEAVAFHVGRLRGLSRHAGALFPRQAAPGWMVSADGLSADAAARDAARREVWGGRWAAAAAAASEFRFPRVGRIVGLPALPLLKARRAVEAPVVVKAAVALANMAVTGADVAVFSTVEHGRVWPFVPAWLAGVLPAAMAVDGPTLEWVLNMVPLPGRGVRRSRGTETCVTVGEWLGGLAEEQKELERHVHAPWDAVLEGLGEEEADVARAASVRQTLVWDVSLPFLKWAGEYETLQPVGRYDWPDCGLFWNACHLDKTNLFLVATWDTAQMNDKQVDGLADGLADLLRRLTSLENWERSVLQVFDEHLVHAEETSMYYDLK